MHRKPSEALSSQRRTEKQPEEDFAPPALFFKRHAGKPQLTSAKHQPPNLEVQAAQKEISAVSPRTPAGVAVNKRYTLKNKGNGIVLTKKVVQRSGGDSRNNAVAPKGSLETSGKPEASAVLNITAPLRKD